MQHAGRVSPPPRPGQPQASRTAAMRFRPGSATGARTAAAAGRSTRFSMNSCRRTRSPSATRPRSGPPAGLTYAAARAIDLNRSLLVRAIFELRALPARLRGAYVAAESQSLLEQTRALGWRELLEVPDRFLVMGAVTRAWEGAPVFRGLPAEEFRDFAEPGYVKILWTLEADPIGPARSRFRTETRASTTDPESRARFRNYWAFVSPGIRTIRRQSLALVRREAVRRLRRGTSG